MWKVLDASPGLFVVTGECSFKQEVQITHNGKKRMLDRMERKITCSILFRVFRYVAVICIVFEISWSLVKNHSADNEILNYEEAKYELDGTIAYKQLNLLRKRVGMPDFIVTLQQADPNWVDSGDEILGKLYEIRRERRIEMALEGPRDEDYSFSPYRRMR